METTKPKWITTDFDKLKREDVPDSLKQMYDERKQKRKVHDIKKRRKYYAENKEKILQKHKDEEISKKYYAKNKEKLKEYDRLYREKNKEKLKEYDRIRKRKHK